MEEGTVKKMTWLYLVPVYIALWLWTWGALMADIQHLSDVNWANREYRSDLGFSCAIALLPPFWLLSPFMTGFYEHGWQLSRRTE
jgi:hypothetical protein